MSDYNLSLLAQGKPRSLIRELVFSFIFPAAVFYLFLKGVPAVSGWSSAILVPVFSEGKALDVFVGHLTTVSLLILAVLLFRKLRGENLFQGVIGGSALQLTKCCLGVFFLFCLFQAWLFVSKQPISKWELDYVLSANQAGFVLFNTAFLVPISEELLYRGVLPVALMNIFLSLRFSGNEPLPKIKKIFFIFCFAISSIIFGLSHARDLSYVLYFIVLGLWFGYWVYRTSGLILPIIGHSLAGMLAVGTIYLRYA